MIIRIASILSWIILLSSTACTTSKIESTNSFEFRTDYIWINSYKVPCASVGKSDCFASQTLEVPENYAWRTFYNDIHGFKYEMGYLYYLKVRVDFVEGGNGTKYTLLEEISKIKDFSLDIAEVWTLDTIYGDSINISENQEQPLIDLKDDNGLMSANTSCNLIAGTVNVYLGSHVSFNMIKRTDKSCPHNELEEKMIDSLNQAETFEVIGKEILILYNQDKEVVATYKKV